MNRISLLTRYLINLSVIIRFREFFIYYFEAFISLKNLHKSKKYLVQKQRYFVGGYCSRQFISYAPKLIKPYLINTAKLVFSDTNSINKYITVFNRHIYSSLLIPSWSDYYEKDTKYNYRLKHLLRKVLTPVKFFGNILKTNKVFGPYALSLVHGEKYYLPDNWFEISVFVFDLGLKKLSKKQKDYFNNKSIVDAGAFIGDSSIVLARYTNNKVYAFEPCSENYRKLCRTIKINSLENSIIPINVALDKHSGSCSVNGTGAGAQVNRSSKNGTRSETLDNYLKHFSEPVGLIKMDVEGYEMNIIAGSLKTIKKHQPILLISIYHNANQYINIPLYMKKNFGNKYKFSFIDCNPVHPLAEKVLLCIPKKLL